MLQFLLPHLTKLTKWEQTRQDLFDEISSLDLDTIKHNGESHGFGKIDEGNSNYNSSSLKNMKIEKEGFFKENFHETYG